MNIGQLSDVTLKEKLKKYVYDIIGCCQDVHREKGPELTEFVYQECLKIALEEHEQAKQTVFRCLIEITFQILNHIN